MSWLFSKALMDSVSLHCLQALVEEYSPDSFSDGEPSAQWNVMPTQQGFWRNDKTMEFSRLSQFGPTLKLLTEDLGEAVLTSYLAAFPARTYQLPEPVKESMESEADCGEKWPASFAKYDHDSSSWKTHQLLLLGGLDEFLETWPRWGSMRNGECWERPTLERPTSESESGLLPTPSATEGGPMPELAHEPRMNQRNYSKKTGKHCQVTLRRWVEMWPTPTATAHKGWSVNHNRAETDDRLDYTVERGAHKAGLSGRLNPGWVEWLMGWPLEWTELKHSATDKSQSVQQQHFKNWLSDFQITKNEAEAA